MEAWPGSGSSVWCLLDKQAPGSGGVVDAYGAGYALAPFPSRVVGPAGIVPLPRRNPKLCDRARDSVTRSRVTSRGRCRRPRWWGQARVPDPPWRHGHMGEGWMGAAGGCESTTVLKELMVCLFVCLLL